MNRDALHGKSSLLEEVSILVCTYERAEARSGPQQGRSKETSADECSYTSVTFTYI